MNGVASPGIALTRNSRGQPRLTDAIDRDRRGRARAVNLDGVTPNTGKLSAVSGGSWGTRWSTARCSRKELLRLVPLPLLLTVPKSPNVRLRLTLRAVVVRALCLLSLRLCARLLVCRRLLRFVTCLPTRLIPMSMIVPRRLVARLVLLTRVLTSVLVTRLVSLL